MSYTAVVPLGNDDIVLPNETEFVVVCQKTCHVF